MYLAAALRNAGNRSRSNLRILSGDMSASSANKQANPIGDTFAVPLVVAVTGHRDLVAGEIPGIRERARQLFRRLQDDYPDRRVQVISGLAEGADQLFDVFARLPGLRTGRLLAAMEARPRQPVTVWTHIAHRLH